MYACMQIMSIDEPMFHDKHALVDSSYSPGIILISNTPKAVTQK